MKVSRNPSQPGIVYDWEDDGASGHIAVDVETRTARPCDETGTPIGRMSLADDGNIREPEPDPAAKRRFMQAVAAVFREWDKTGELPGSVHRSYG